MEVSLFGILSAIADWFSYKRRTRFKMLNEAHFRVVPDLSRELRQFLGWSNRYFSQNILNGEPPKPKQRELFIERASAFFRAFEHNRCYFNEKVYVKIEQLMTKFYEIENADYYGLSSQFSPKGPEREKRFDEVHRKLKNELFPLMFQIDVEFHKLLGSHYGLEEHLRSLWDEMVENITRLNQ